MHHPRSSRSGLMGSLTDDKIIGLGLGVYLISLGAQTLLHFPLVEHRIQLPELVFLPLLLFGIYSLYRRIPSLNQLDWAVLLYFVAQIFSGLIVKPEKTVILELTGRLYLVLVYFLFRWGTAAISGPLTKALLLRSFNLLGLLLASVGILGWGIAILLGLPNLAVQLFAAYPYFGDLYRVTGWTWSPTMFIMLLMPGLLFTFSQFLDQRSGRWYLGALLGLMSVAALLTFSKSLLLVLLGGILLLFYRNNMNVWWQYSVSTVVIIGFIFSSHLLVVKKHSDMEGQLQETVFTSNEVLLEFEDIQVLESFYWASKRCTWSVARDHWLWGVGPGNFSAALQELDPDQFPLLQKTDDFDPHSTYLGALAETGLFGLMSLLWLWYVAIRQLFRRQVQQSSPFTYAFLIIMMLFLIEGITTDIMNFRQVWVLFGVINVARY